MLNEIIGLLDHKQVFDFLGLEKSQEFLREMIHLATREYDCNAGEILEGYTNRFQLCYCCSSATTDLEEGLCPKCRS
jgi:hypothetical protein